MAYEYNADQVTGPQRLNEVAAILATGLWRLLAKRAPAPKKRAFCRDNRLEVSRETSPDAIDL